LQANRKTLEGLSHPDRDGQFRYIARQVGAALRGGRPVVSVDTKKKELVGEFKNVGREWAPHGEPEPVKTHDFPDKQLGKAIPYGVYDLASNEGWVSVGIDHDTARFAAASIGRWWREMGTARFKRARRLLITADGGGSNSSRNRLWKVALQELADDTQLQLEVCHFPPGTSKWNKIEHRLFCFITNNWRGRPLISYQTIVNLIGSTTTKAGLIVKAALDTAAYETGIKVTDTELAKVRCTRAAFHGDWNYTITPRG
jgi:Rhodopirellula transposase DDE domain